MSEANTLDSKSYGFKANKDAHLSQRIFYTPVAVIESLTEPSGQTDGI